MQILGIEIGHRTDIQVPLISVVSGEFEVGILPLVRLFHDGVFEVIAEAQGSVAMVVVVHPLVHRRSLFTYRLERRMGL